MTSIASESRPLWHRRASLAFFGFFAVLLFVSMTSLRRGQMDADEAAIRATIQHYFDGHAGGGPAAMRQAFHDVTTLYWVADGELRQRPVAEYIANASTSPAADEAQRRRRIASIDIAGTSAVAKLELDYPGAFITDYMSLLKIDGEWRIVGKIFNVERR